MVAASLADFSAAASPADISAAEMEKSKQTETGDERQRIGLCGNTEY